MFESRGGRKIKVIDDVASQWDELAKALGFGDEDIDRIKCTFPNSYEACREMLAKWLEGDESLIGPVIWTTLIQSLINAGLVDVADNIREGLNFAEKDDKVIIVHCSLSNGVIITPRACTRDKLIIFIHLSVYRLSVGIKISRSEDSGIMMVGKCYQIVRSGEKQPFCFLTLGFHHECYKLCDYIGHTY